MFSRFDAQVNQQNLVIAMANVVMKKLEHSKLENSQDIKGMLSDNLEDKNKQNILQVIFRLLKLPDSRVASAVFEFRNRKVTSDELYTAVTRLKQPILDEVSDN